VQKRLSDALQAMWAFSGTAGQFLIEQLDGQIPVILGQGMG